LYDSSFNYENGKSKSKLADTNSVSWHNKSWEVGVKTTNHAKAYDWNCLNREKLIINTLGGVQVLLALAADAKNFFAFEMPVMLL
jgi:hypothetical protein